MMKKKDGFREQRLFVLPEYMQQELAAMDLTRCFHVSDIGFFPRARHHYRERPEGTDSLVFIYCTEGQGCVEMAGGTPVEIKSGSLVIIPAGVPHRYWASQDNPWSIYWFHLKGEHAGELVRLYRLANGPLRPSSSFVSEFIGRIDQSIAFLSDRPYDVHSHVYVSQTMRWLISNLGHEFMHASQDRKRGQHLQNAVRYMKEHIASPIRLSDLEKFTGISRQHLVYLFNKETGFPPIEYFLRMKMQQAANMLDLTDLTVKEIAASLGFSDPYYFSRIFKKVMNHSPTHYRNIPKG